MPLRERVKRVFHRSSKSSSSSSQSSSNLSSRNSIFYQPGEKMPTPKYRRPVAKEHKEKLEAFNFADAWRRKSESSLYSPMGSRIPSRKNSFARRSFQKSRMGEVDEGTDEEADVGNVGLSRRVSKSKYDPSSSSSRPHSSHAKPFDAEDLTLALKKSHLDVPP